MGGYLAIQLDLIWGTLVEGLPLVLRFLFGARQLSKESRHASLTPQRPELACRSVRLTPARLLCGALEASFICGG